MSFNKSESSEMFNNMLKQADFLNQFKQITNAIMHNTGYYSKNLEERIHKYKKLGVKKEIITSMVLIQQYLKEKGDLLLNDTNEFIKLQVTDMTKIDSKRELSSKDTRKELLINAINNI